MPKQKWIPVTERLPDRYICVLVTVKRTDLDGKTDVFVQTGCRGFDGDWYVRGEPLAWMELPEPYRAERK